MPDLSEAARASFDPKQRKEMDRLMKQARKDKAIVNKATEDLREALRRLRLKDDEETHEVLHALAALEGE